MSFQLDKDADGIRLKLEQCRFNKYSFDNQLTLEAELPDTFLNIQIESTFSLHNENQITELDFSNSGSIPDLQYITDLDIKLISMSNDGSLTINFSDNVTLKVGPHPDYEAWTLHLGNTLQVVCRPGGTLAVWES